MEIWDISPLISARTAVFPGDVPFSQNISMSFQNGDHLKLSSINTTTHIGAHVDAPSHYNARGLDIDQVSLTPYLGRAQVIEVELGKNTHVEPQHFSNHEIKAQRILFKTNSFTDPDSWNENFKAISSETIKFLKEKNVVLVGIDTPSVDLSSSKDLPGHNEFYQSNIRVLEGIILSEVQEGIYELIALPLKLEGLDASPVRAILRR